MKEVRIAVLAGDGIGEECMKQALRVLLKAGDLAKYKFVLNEGLVGGSAYERYENHFPEETYRICLNSDAILFGSVGGPVNETHLPKWKNCETNSILAIRKKFKFNSNWRPVKVHDALFDSSPLKNDRLYPAVDMLIVRELNGDIYFGEHSRCLSFGKVVARDIAEYSEDQIRTVAKIAFEVAGKRRNKVTSVDKANVLETSKLWREIVHEAHSDYSEIVLEDMLVDNCAMQLVVNPSQFDVILAPNLFGDILSDLAAAIPGSLGLMPSASFNEDGFGLYEPAGGSAPTIAGLGIANPIAQILCVANMLKYSFNLHKEAEVIENAVISVLNQGYRTQDLLAGQSCKVLGTEAITEMILQAM